MSPCAHVEAAETDEVVRVVAGTAIPFFGWSKELEADVPLLRCSECGATARLPGAAVDLANRTTARNRVSIPELGSPPDDWDLL